VDTELAMGRAEPKDSEFVPRSNVEKTNEKPRIAGDKLDMKD